MTNNYIALDRTFNHLQQYDEPDGIDENHFDWESVWERDPTDSIGWPELIEQDKIVILAEAGTGKTEELKEIARQLHAQGLPSFFLRLELLLESDFQVQSSLDTSQRERFQNWQETDSTESIAYFFLDSVDEAKLQKPRALDVILSRLVDRVGAERLDRAKIFVTSRFSEWRVESDLHIFRERLLPLSHQAAETKRLPFVYRLNPLNNEQITRFSQHYGISDPSLFIRQIHQADAISFAQRPQDLIDLIAYWQDHSKQLPEKYIELVQFSIDKKLCEVDAIRAQQLPLSREDAHLGAELLAAATTLCKRNT